MGKVIFQWQLQKRTCSNIMASGKNDHNICFEFETFKSKLYLSKDA